MEPESALASRAAYSIARLGAFRVKVVSDVPELQRCPNLCIYTTGSYGRLEASPYSDLDLFLVRTGDPVAPATETAIRNGLSRVAESLGHEPFSKDGLYLKVHSVSDLSQKIGHPNEDAENIFTARMLLLLESEPVFNEQAHSQAVAECINAYCRDYANHPNDFHARFLANDIMRYWKTLCLNYENNRGTKVDDKAKYRLKNYKLKFSRMMICFSMISCLCDRNESDDPGKLVRLARMKPVDRLKMISSKHGLDNLFGQLVSEYAWFLGATGQNRAGAEAWLTENKSDAFRRAGTFGDSVYRLLQEVASATKSDLRYLVV